MENIPNSISYLISKITGFCSIIYMFFFAEILLALYDSTQVYSLTFAMFLLGIIIGHFLISKIKTKSENIFLFTEFALPLISIISTILILLIYKSAFNLLISLLLSSGLILIIGILTGFETELIHKHNPKSKIKYIYLNQVNGAILGSIVFSLIMLPFFDLFSSIIFVGFLNIVIAAIYIIIRDKASKKFKFDLGEILTIIFIIFYLYLAFKIPQITIFAEKLVFGGLS